MARHVTALIEERAADHHGTREAYFLSYGVQAQSILHHGGSAGWQATDLPVRIHMQGGAFVRRSRASLNYISWLLASHDVDVYALYNGSVQYTEATEPTVQNFARNHSLGSSLAYWSFSLVFTARIDSFMSYAMDQTTLPSSSGRDAYSRLKHSVIPRDGIVQVLLYPHRDGRLLHDHAGERGADPPETTRKTKPMRSVSAAAEKSTLGLGTEGGGRTAYAGGDALWESGGQDDGADGRRAGDAAKVH
ncbi:predicted protein [Postia placenta Mad-698-R]|nr:predicted protein [Postia placenta Mad-698-R]